jgi:hypothetical protein
MTDATAIASAYQSLKAAFDIGKALVGLGISAEIRAKISEMNERILAAQDSAIAGRDYQTTLLKQIGDLEKKIAELETWDTEAETYQLTNVRVPHHPMGSAFAYAPKEGTHKGKPSHLICASCYQERHKSILQAQRLDPGACQTLICPRCDVIIYLNGTPEPEHFGLKPKRSKR